MLNHKDVQHASPKRLSATTGHFERTDVGGSMRRERSPGEPTSLALFVRRRLDELDLKQSEFCKLTGFDQGLLSKIQNSVISSLSLESALRLALGLNVSPKVVFDLTSRPDMQELVLSAYATDFFPELSQMSGSRVPTPVFELVTMALSAYSLGRSLEPAYAVLSYLSARRKERRDGITSSAVESMDAKS
jgi:transcriptional regulator with XRE-family HTH domain